MPSLKELRNRISSVQATQKITRAMQMVAASKLRRAQEAAEAARPYAERMDAVLANLSAAMEGRLDAPRLMVGTGKSERHLLVVATAERGLCGGFNSSISRMARDHAEQLIADGKTVQFLMVGRKGYDVLKRTYNDKILDVIEIPSSGAKFVDAEGISRRVLDMFGSDEFDVCTIFYSRFISVASNKPTGQQLVPAILPESDEEGHAGVDLGGAVYDYEPEEDEILEELLPRNLSVQVFRALLENAARIGSFHNRSK